MCQRCRADHLGLRHHRQPARAGIVRLRSGTFPQGSAAVIATYTAGYTAEEIATNTAHEVLLLKALLLSIIQREVALNRENKRHLRTHSWGDESSSYNFDLTRNEERLLRMLKKQ